MVNLFEFKKQIREILEKYIEVVEGSKEASKQNKLKNMNAYETVPGEDDLKKLTPAEGEAFDEQIKPLKEKGILLVNEILEKIENKRTEAPTTEAVNYISMLKIKKNISEIEIEQALARYGNVYIIYEALQQIAADNKIYLPDNKIDIIEDEIGKVEKAIRNMGARDAQHVTPGFIQFALLTFDANIPDEI